MTDRFTGKTILITGGNSGIGLATAKRLVSEGATVFITGRDEESLKRAVSELGSKASAIRADISSVAGIDQMFAEVKKRTSNLDGVFANAGVAKFGSAADMTEEDFDTLYNTNVKGLFFTLQKALPFLKKGSSVVVTGSVAGSRGTPGMTVYGSTKSAVRNFTRSFANEFVSQGIRFNTLSPGPIETPIWGRDGGDTSPASIEKKAATNPMKRFGTPDECAAAAAYLLSSESSYTTGAELFVDGGVNQL